MFTNGSLSSLFACNKTHVQRASGSVSSRQNILIDRKDATLEVLSKSKTVVALSTRTACLVIFKHGNKKLPKFVYPDDEESQQKIPVIAKLFELACLVANF